MVKLITVATHSDGYFPWLIKSCERYNVPLVVLGWGKKWQGFTWRFTLMIEYLKTLESNELVCFIDAYDVILLRSLDEIEEYYNTITNLTNKKIILGEDTIQTIFQNIAIKSQYGTCKNTSINAGTYLGKAIDILELLLPIKNISNFNDDDQVILTKECNNNPELFYIDTDKIFFLTIPNNFDEITEYKNIKIINTQLFYMNTQPFFFHGPGFTSMIKLIKQLNYSITDEQIDNINNKANESFTKRTISNIKLLLINKFMIIIFCLFIIYYFFIRNKKFN